MKYTMPAIENMKRQLDDLVKEGIKMAKKIKKQQKKGK